MMIPNVLERKSHAILAFVNGAGEQGSACSDGIAMLSLFQPVLFSRGGGDGDGDGGGAAADCRLQKQQLTVVGSARL